MAMALLGRRGGVSKEPSNSGRVRSLYCHVGSGKDCASDCKSESNAFFSDFESECACESKNTNGSEYINRTSSQTSVDAIAKQ